MPSKFRLADVLDERGLTQSDLARLSGVSLPRINEICLGKAKAVSLATLDQIAGALKISICDLIEERKR